MTQEEKDGVKSAVLTLHTLIESVTNDFKTWCADKTIPLDERWEVFNKVKLGVHDTYYWSFKSFDENSFHDGDYISKYQTVTPDQVLDRFHPNDGYGLKWEGDYESEAIKFKEEVLAEFIQSWEFDW